MNIKKIQKEIERHMASVAKERNSLDDFIATLSELREDCDSAYDSLITARDYLSELV